MPHFKQIVMTHCKGVEVMFVKIEVTLKSCILLCLVIDVYLCRLKSTFDVPVTEQKVTLGSHTHHGLTMNPKLLAHAYTADDHPWLFIVS